MTGSDFVKMCDFVGYGLTSLELETTAHYIKYRLYLSCINPFSFINKEMINAWFNTADPFILV